MEMDVPIRVHRIRLAKDSAGPGTFRGGLGADHEYEILHGDVTVTYRGERHFVAPHGAQGGGDGQCAEAVVVRADGREEVIPSKQVVVLHQGDRLRVRTSGGGGFGPPAARDPARVRDDLANGKVSVGSRALA
jgi:N-methylhydantoinase B